MDINDNTLFGRPESEQRSALAQGIDDLKEMAASGKLDRELVDQAVERAKGAAAAGDLRGAFAHLTAAGWPEG
jgi:hypothetical protein